MIEAHYLLTASIMSRYAFIAACAEPWPVGVVCRVLGVSPSGYYQWRGAKPAPAAGNLSVFTRPSQTTPVL